MLADEAIADSSTTEKKVRQQVEAEGPELAGKTDEMASRPMTIPSDNVVQSDDLLSLSQLRLTATVCPRCKAVYRSGGMEWSTRLIPKNKVSTGNAETTSAVE